MTASSDSSPPSRYQTATPMPRSMNAVLSGTGSLSAPPLPVRPRPDEVQAEVDLARAVHNRRWPVRDGAKHRVPARPAARGKRREAGQPDLVIVAKEMTSGLGK
jgi:hypothetical protein